MGDNSELEALFEQVREQSVAAMPVTTAGRESIEVNGLPCGEAGRANETDEQGGSQAMFVRIGQLTRNLHDALRELGYDKAMEKAMHALPDTRERLAYIANLTGQAAERTLEAAEAGKRHVDKLQLDAAVVSAGWERVYAGTADITEFRATADLTRAFVASVPVETGAANAQLTEIMLAQDFHDLTGQVINRIVKLAGDMERELVSLLIETSTDTRGSADQGFLNGPVINASRQTDVLTSQQQVDDLLDSLGF